MKYFFTLILLEPIALFGQQGPDTTFTTGIENPKFAKEQGPVVCMDSAHNSRHTINNGFARLDKQENGPDIFSKENGRLKVSEITKDIESVTSFTGSAFTYPENEDVIMKFNKGDLSLEPEIAWQFSDSTKTVPLDNYAQGALMNYGKGKIAVFGEAAMFTARDVTNENGTFKVGFNSPLAPNNQQFAVILMRYLVD